MISFSYIPTHKVMHAQTEQGVSLLAQEKSLPKEAQQNTPLCAI